MSEVADQLATPLPGSVGRRPGRDPRVLAALGTVAVLATVGALVAVLLTTSNRSRTSVEHVRRTVDVPLAQIEEALDASRTGEAQLQLAAATTGAERSRHLQASIAAGERTAESWARYQAVALPLDDEPLLAARYERDAAAGKEAAAEAIVPILQVDGPAALTPAQIDAAMRNEANLRALRQLYQEEGASTLQTLDARMTETGRRIRIGGAGCLLLIALAGIVAMRSAARTVDLRRVRADAAELATFESRLVRGLDLLEDDDQALGAAARALGIAMPAASVGISTMDLGETTMRTAAGALRCSLEGAARCPAIRAGVPLRFEDSSALDACPLLIDAPACSATCIPISISGRSAGVVQLADVVGRPPEPGGAVQVVLRRVGERITMMRANARFELQASRDPLTGLINRRSLEGAVTELRATGTDYAIAFADLDHFKRLNDVFGHQAGDRALRSFASTLSSGLRDVDVACRWGGEEFVVVLPGCGERDAIDAMERVRTQLADAGASETEPVVTVSIGIAVRQSGETFDETLARADAALNTAKTTGRDRVVRWTPAPEAGPHLYQVGG